MFSTILFLFTWTEDGEGMRAWGGKEEGVKMGEGRGRVVMPQICRSKVCERLPTTQKVRPKSHAHCEVCSFIQTFNLINGSRAAFNQFSWNSSCIKHLLAKFFLEAKCLGFALD